MRGISLLVARRRCSLGCSTGRRRPSRCAAPKAQAQLQTLLAGKVAGAAVSCLPHYRANDMIVDRRQIPSLFRRRPQPRLSSTTSQGGCCDARHGPYALVTRTSRQPACAAATSPRWSIVQNGITVGSCVFGDFVPYTRPQLTT